MTTQAERIAALEERLDTLEAPQREADEREREEREAIAAEEKAHAEAAKQLKAELAERPKLEQEAREEIVRRAAEGLTANARGPAEKSPELAITEEVMEQRNADFAAREEAFHA
jgi:hypothetical protein